MFFLFVQFGVCVFVFNLIAMSICKGDQQLDEPVGSFGIARHFIA